jgi:hypothetical protein
LEKVVFLNVVRDETARTVTKTVNYVNLGLAIGFLLVILGAAFVAHNFVPAWESASDQLLTAFTGGVGLVVGALLGENAG